MSPSVALQQFEWMQPNIPLNFRKALTSLPSWTDPPYLTDKRTYQQSNLCEIYWNLCRKRQVKYSIKVWFCSVSKSWINCKLGRLAGEAIPVPAVIAPILKKTSIPGELHTLVVLLPCSSFLRLSAPLRHHSYIWQISSQISFPGETPHCSSVLNF